MKNESINNPVTQRDQYVADNPIVARILQIRGQNVLMDKDLADLYGVQTRVLNQAVKRNIERFPERFRFQLTEIEKIELVTNCDRLANLKHSSVCPYVFTEQGIAMLATVLHSKTAIEISIAIMDAFVVMRRFLMANAGLSQRIEKLEVHQQITDSKIDVVLQRMNKLAPSVLPEQIFATGCIWDAWDYVSQLVRSAKQRIVLIDNFIDERVLSLLTKRTNGVSATIYTRYTEQLKIDLIKHNQQYTPILCIQLPRRIHDRFFIIDDTVYLLGASVKDMGTGLCAITKMEVCPDDIFAALR